MSLIAGSIAFVAYSGDNANEGFTFVALEPIPAGTVLSFKVATTPGVAPAASFTWTAPSTITTGTLVSFINLQSTNPTVQIGTGPATTIPAITGWDFNTGMAIYAQEGSTYLTALGSGTVEQRAGMLTDTGLTNTGDGRNAVLFTTSTASFNSFDVGTIRDSISDHSFVDAAQARYHLNLHNASNDSNWAHSPGVNDGTAINLDPEGDPLNDPHSELSDNNGKIIILCFLAGTLIRTPTGEVVIESLSIGDEVMTDEGPAAVRWIGRQTRAKRFARSLPVRIAAGALGENVPVRDLFLSPGHSLLLDDLLVQAGALVNGTTITYATDVPDTFVYYNLEFDRHAVIFAEGAAAESFVDNAERENFDNWVEHEELYGHLPPLQELPYPVVKAARQLPGRLKARLAERAAELGFAMTSAA